MRPLTLSFPTGTVFIAGACFYHNRRILSSSTAENVYGGVFVHRTLPVSRPF